MVLHRRCLLTPGLHHHFGQHKEFLKKKKSYRCRLNRPVWEVVKFEVFKNFYFLTSNQNKGKIFSSFLVKIYYFLRSYLVGNLNMILKAVMESIIC